MDLISRDSLTGWKLSPVHECAGSSRIEGLDGDAIEDMIEIVKSIAHDKEHGFERTKDEKACG